MLAAGVSRYDPNPMGIGQKPSALRYELPPKKQNDADGHDDADQKN